MDSELTPVTESERGTEEDGDGFGIQLCDGFGRTSLEDDGSSEGLTRLFGVTMSSLVISASRGLNISPYPRDTRNGWWTNGDCSEVRLMA